MPNSVLETRVTALEAAVRAIVELLDACNLAGTNSGEFQNLRQILDEPYTDG